MISLLPWSDDDWPRAWSWYQKYYSRVSDDFSPQTIVDFVALKTEQAYPRWHRLGVYQDGELGGILEVEILSPVLGQVHASFKRSFWGREITTPAVEQGVEYCWSIGLEKLWCVFYLDNSLLAGLLERVGGIREGVLKSHTRRNGQMVDMVSWAIFRR